MNQWAAYCLILKLYFELCLGTDVQVVPGSSLVLPCVHSPTDYTEITWKFNGDGIKPENSEITVKNNGAHLSISPITAANAGEYVCSVMDNSVELRRTYHVVIKALISYTMVVGKGASVKLPCSLSHSEHVEANALWFRETSDGNRTALISGNDTVSLDKRAELLYPLDQDQTLKISEVTEEDEGVYHCDSAEGVTLSTIRLIVELVPTPVPHSCQNFTTPWEICEDKHGRISGPVLQESLTEFSMRAYSYLRESNPNSNLLFSPISISGALSHLLLGARSNTRAAIERAVCLPHDFYCVHFQLKRLREKMSSSLQMASQIYYNTPFNLSESFLNQSMEFYDSEPVKLLNSSERNTEMINSWVADKTKNQIKQLVQSVSPYTQLLLLNAVSFSGMWITKFDEKPMKRHFTKQNGDLVTVPVLYHNKFQGAMMLSAALKAQVMRFGLTGNNSLYILLPPSYHASDLQKVELRMTEMAVREMISQLRSAPPQGIEVTLPQIKLKDEPDMYMLMKKLGLSSLFEDGNLCGMYTEEPLLLGEAKHKAYLVLNENGVEAGAVTALGYSRSFLSFSALRPFILLLWNDQADVPLFIGRIIEP